MKRLSLLFLLLVCLTEGHAQRMPPSLFINFDDQKTEREVLKDNYQYTIQHIKGRIRKCEIATTPISFESMSDHYIHKYGIVISLETTNAKYEHFVPQKGDVAGLYLKDRTSGKTMRLFIRFCHDLYRGLKVPLRSLEFHEGTFFYDMCLSESRYQTEFKALCREQFKPGEYAFQPFLELGDIEAHRIRLSRLNTLLKKYNCHD
ncbi:MAG TPA: hypothetical protein VK183_07245 [Flavobacterium sp.]|nr:hypothetical protein [Flavobacterium sp.]